MIAGARDNRQMTHHTLFAPNDSLQDITTDVKELRDKLLHFWLQPSMAQQKRSIYVIGKHDARDVV